MSRRDTFRSRVYDAEIRADFWLGRPLNDFAVTGDQWATWLADLGRAAGYAIRRSTPVRFRKMRATAGAAAAGQIWVSPEAPIAVLLHEYAHILHWGAIPHGVRWAQAYIRLLRAAPTLERVPGWPVDAGTWSSNMRWLATMADKLEREFLATFGPRRWRSVAAEPEPVESGVRAVPVDQAACQGRPA